MPLLDIWSTLSDSESQVIRLEQASELVQLLNTLEVEVSSWNTQMSVRFTSKWMWRGKG